MPSITLTLIDTPTGGVAIQSSFTPAIGAPCSAAQPAALDIIRRTRHEWGVVAKSQPVPAPGILHRTYVSLPAHQEAA